jgi:hypothetical protein
MNAVNTQPVKQFTLLWSEDLSSEQFDELKELSRQRVNALRLQQDADERYFMALRNIARPLIDAKLAAIGATMKPWDQTKVQMVNEGFANPQPLLTIRVSNAPDPGSIAVMDSTPSGD